VGEPSVAISTLPYSPRRLRALRFGGSNDQEIARHVVGDAVGDAPGPERATSAHPDVADDDEAGIPAVGELDDSFGRLGPHRLRPDGDGGGFRAGFGRLDGINGSLHAGFVLVHREEQHAASRRPRQLERDPFGDRGGLGPVGADRDRRVHLRLLRTA
jgi:hypothetical protein